MEVRFNYFFFIIAVVIPLIVAPLGIIILWPLVFNPYQILGVYGSIIVAYIWMFIFTWGIAAYMALPWLAVIKEDRIVFHRLFRKKLVIGLDKVKKMEVITKKLPVKDYPWEIGSISFKMSDGDEWLVSGISHGIILKIYDVAEKKGIPWEEIDRKLTEEEKGNLQKRGY